MKIESLARYVVFYSVHNFMLCLGSLRECRGRFKDVNLIFGRFTCHFGGAKTSGSLYNAAAKNCPDS